MKTNYLFLLIVFLTMGFSACSNDDNTEPTSYAINQHEILLLPDSKSVESKNTNIMYPYKNETSGDFEYSISFKGYFMQGLSGIAHNIPENIKKLEIPESGIRVRVTGEAKKGEYNSVPEILPIDFYCTTIEIITE